MDVKRIFLIFTDVEFTRMKKILTILLVSVTGTLVAQDAYFSQPFSNPMLFNPALTGKFDGSLRLTANYRDQWPSVPKAYVTSAASIDFPMLKRLLPEHDVLGIGFSGMSDVTANGALKYNYASMAVSYHKSLDENGYYSVGAGFQGTYANTLLNTANIVFEDELTSGGFIGNTSGEYLGSTPLTGKASYMDLSTGILLSATTDGANQFTLGYSLYHLNGPEINLRTDQTIYNPWKIAKRSVVHASAHLPIGEKSSADVSVVHQAQYKSYNTIFGGSLAIKAGSAEESLTNIHLGGWVRMNDAFIPAVGLEFNGIKIMTSFDINISDVKSATAGNGGYEVSLSYIRKRTVSNDYWGSNVAF